MGQHTPSEDQRRLVELWTASDASMAAFARAHDVRPGTFATWVERHRNHGQSLRSAAFLQVVTPDPVPPVASFSVRVGPHQLAFDAPPPASWFAAVLREIGPC